MNKISRHIALLLPILTALIVLPAVSHAQYFISEHLKTEVLDAGKYDSVILLSATPYAVPALNDTFPLMYHEPRPDSIMPRSAVVIGTITVQELNADDVVPAVEKYARQLGADWLVSFQEPRATVLKNGWRVYRSRALLLRVLDDQFIKENNIAYTYEEKANLPSYAAISHWFDQYKGYGAELSQPDVTGSAEMDQLAP